MQPGTGIQPLGAIGCCVRYHQHLCNTLLWEPNNSRGTNSISWIPYQGIGIREAKLCFFVMFVMLV